MSIDVYELRQDQFYGNGRCYLLVTLQLLEIALVLVASRSCCQRHRKRGSQHHVNGCKTLLLFDDYRRAFATGVEKVLGHSFWQANATVRRRIPRNIALVHCVATVEMHAVGHLRAIEMCPRRLR